MLVEVKIQIHGLDGGSGGEAETHTGGGSVLDRIQMAIPEALWMAIRARRGGVCASPLAFWASSGIVRDAGNPPGTSSSGLGLNRGEDHVHIESKFEVQVEAKSKCRSRCMSRSKYRYMSR